MHQIRRLELGRVLVHLVHRRPALLSMPRMAGFKDAHPDIDLRLLKFTTNRWAPLPPQNAVPR
jgi:hypothetical protein